MRISDWSSDVCSSDLKISEAGPDTLSGICFALMSAVTLALSMLVQRKLMKQGENVINTVLQYNIVLCLWYVVAMIVWPMMEGEDGFPDWSIRIRDRKSTRLNSSH